MEENNYGSKPIEEAIKELKNEINDVPRPMGRGIGAFGSSSGLDFGSSAKI